MKVCGPRECSHTHSTRKPGACHPPINSSRRQRTEAQKCFTVLRRENRCLYSSYNRSQFDGNENLQRQLRQYKRWMKNQEVIRTREGSVAGGTESSTAGTRLMRVSGEEKDHEFEDWTS